MDCCTVIGMQETRQIVTGKYRIHRTVNGMQGTYIFVIEMQGNYRIVIGMQEEVLRSQGTYPINSLIKVLMYKDMAVSPPLVAHVVVVTLCGSLDRTSDDVTASVE